jgi:hypothetical protein
MARGGKREGAGRPPGRRDRATVEQKATLMELAQQYTDIALAALKDVAVTGSDSARVAAATAILDRAYGRPRQAIEVAGEEGGPLQVHIVRFSGSDNAA